MKKMLFVLGALVAGFAWADNIITSREYVDAQANTLQSELPAKNENTVLINTDTAGTPGEKAIYDASAAFSAQTDTLVTAGQFNTAVQNALESEFVCIERQNGNGGCLLYEITATRPINLLNPANIHQGSISSGTDKGIVFMNPARCYFDYIPVHSGDIVNFTSKNGTPPAYSKLWLYSEQSEASFIQLVNGIQITIGNNVGYKYTIPQDSYIRGIWLQKDQFTCDQIVDPMLEISATPHEYVPYGNVYLPQN